MAREDQIEFSIPDGAFDDMAEYITKTLKRDVDKRKQLLTLLRKAGKHYLDVVRVTSKSDKYHPPRTVGEGSKQATYSMGNLSRNMKFFNGKNRENITVSIGPRVRGKAPSGYYGAMILPWARSKADHIQKGRDWKGDALRRAGTKTREETLNALEKYMKSKLKRLRKAGFKVD